MAAVPAYCFIVGVVHPPNLLVGQSSKVSFPSQCGYQRGQLAKSVQVSLLPIIWFHMQALAYIPTLLPLAYTACTNSCKKTQFWAPVPWFQVHPELGLVSISSQMVPVVYQYLEAVPGVFIIESRQSTSSLTWRVAFLPRQGNMQTSVERPLRLDCLIFSGAVVSMAPQLWQALMMECSYPRSFMQGKLLKVPAMSNTFAV